MQCSTPKVMKLRGNIHNEPSVTSNAQPATCAQRRQNRDHGWRCSSAIAWPTPAQKRKRLTMAVRCVVQNGSERKLCVMNPK